MKRPTDEQLKNAVKFVGEFKCPKCKAYALYVEQNRKEAWVYCRKCAFNMKLSDFVVQHMKFQLKDGKATVEVPTPYGDIETKEI